MRYPRPRIRVRRRCAPCASRRLRGRWLGTLPAQRLLTPRARLPRAAAHLNGNPDPRRAHLAQRRVRSLGNRARHRPQGAPAGARRRWRRRRRLRDPAGRGSDALPVGDPDRHHLDRRAQRHRRRGRACRAARRLARRSRHGGGGRALRRHGPGGRADHLLHDRRRRARAQAARAVASRSAGAAGRAAGRLSRGRDQALRAPAVDLDAGAAARARRAQRRRRAGDRGGDPRAARRRHLGRRDRVAGTHDGAQRVPARRPPDRLADGAAWRRRRARHRCAVRGEPQAHRGERPRTLPGGARRAVEHRRRGQRARSG